MTVRNAWACNAQVGREHVYGCLACQEPRVHGYAGTLRSGRTTPVRDEHLCAEVVTGDGIVFDTSIQMDKPSLSQNPIYTACLGRPDLRPGSKGSPLKPRPCSKAVSGILFLLPSSPLGGVAEILSESRTRPRLGYPPPPHQEGAPSFLPPPRVREILSPGPSKPPRP